MSDSDVAQKPSQGLVKRPKPKYPKVKTGCRTCRLRRVKCEETKPECRRCLKFGGEGFCDGYDQEQNTSGSYAPVAKNAPSETFQSEEEYHCLRYYAEETAPGLGGIVGGRFWDQLLLQTGSRQPFIRHAIITIGALSKVFKLGGVRGESSFIPRTRMSEDEVEIQRFYLFALQQYHKFICGTRAYVSEHENDKRVMLISSLLVTCIERLQNHKQSSLTQARSGLKIMQQWIENKTAEVTNTASCTWTIASVPGMVSPAPHIIEDDIVQQFRQLELSTSAAHGQAFSRGKWSSEEEAALAIMPPIFTTIDDARLYLELILRRAYHFIADAHRALASKKPIVAVRYSDDEGNPVINEEPTSRETSEMSMDDYYAEQREHAADNKRWDHAFQHLFRHIQKSLSPSHPNSLLAMLLKIRSLSLSIRLAGSTSVSEMVYDTSMSEYQKLVSLATLVSENSQILRDGSFCFDHIITHELEMVALTCRDRAVRREAIDLLESKDWREDIWGSRRMADCARFVMETEEGDVETDFIPEAARARLFSIDVDVEKRKAVIKCLQGVGAGVVLKSSVRDWTTFH